MLRKITSFALGLGFIHYFSIISAREGGSTGEVCKLRYADHKEQRMTVGKHKKGQLSGVQGGFRKFRAPAPYRSLGMELKAGGTGENPLQLTE